MRGSENRPKRALGSCRTSVLREKGRDIESSCNQKLTLATRSRAVFPPDRINKVEANAQVLSPQLGRPQLREQKGRSRRSCRFQSANPISVVSLGTPSVFVAM